MPTTIPTEVQTVLDNGSDLIINLGLATLAVILIVSVVKYVRGVA